MDSLHSRKLWRASRLTGRHCGARNRWARERLNWRVHKWCCILFSNECMICLWPDNSQRRVCRELGNDMHLDISFQESNEEENLCFGWHHARKLDATCRHLGQYGFSDVWDRILWLIFSHTDRHLVTISFFKIIHMHTKVILSIPFLNGQNFNRTEWPTVFLEWT